MPPKSSFRLNKGILVVTLQDVERLNNLIVNEQGSKWAPHS